MMHKEDIDETTWDKELDSKVQETWNDANNWTQEEWNDAVEWAVDTFPNVTEWSPEVVSKAKFYYKARFDEYKESK